MAKHISGGLRVLIYEGFTSTPIYPKKMLVYDVVITTYAVLQAELRLTENERETNLRKPPKYSKPCSSIAQMIWWRLCFDEAQMIDCQGMISKMAEKLSAVNRWAVTGTPISRGVSGNFFNSLYLPIYSKTICCRQQMQLVYKINILKLLIASKYSFVCDCTCFLHLPYVIICNILKLEIT